ncbi:phage holin family protein, partial [Planosporangium flavigriseum]|uniref:phage holin family protein n=1 Tax=Planosporangium flavigriseum TaxID=373681 RepID=UPI001EF33A3B
QPWGPQPYPPQQPWGPQPYPPQQPWGPQPYPPHHAGVRAPAPAPAFPPPRIEPVPGTEFGLAYFNVPPVVSGQAIGSMVAGILSILVSLVVSCFGLAGAKPGWGPIVAGAFAVLAATTGLAAIGLGWYSVRHITRSGGRLVGRGMAIAGMSCGAAGLLLTTAAMVLALLI